jgi:hypothetical protein
MTVDRVEVTKMSGPELVALYNQLTGEKVKRFADRKAGLARVLKALGEEGAPAAASEPSAAPESNAAPEPAPTPAAAANASSKPERKARKAAGAKAGKPAAAAAPRETKSEYKGAKGGKEPRPESKRGQLLAILRGPGITVEAMMKKFDWKVTDCRDVLNLLAKQNGVATVRDEDGKWRAKSKGSMGS